MNTLRQLLSRVARKRYLPFTQPRYPGPYPMKSGMAQNFSAKAVSALPLYLGFRGRGSMAVSRVKRMTPNWPGDPYDPYHPDRDPFRSVPRKVEPRPKPFTPKWYTEPGSRPRVSTYRRNYRAIQTFIAENGYEAFRQKICADRARRREVLHATGVAGGPVSAPNFDIVSRVRC